MRAIVAAVGTEVPGSDPPHVDAEVIRLYVREGAKTADITEQTGVPRPMIYRILRRHGYEPDRQGRRAEPTPAELESTVAWLVERIERQAQEIGRLRQVIHGLGHDPDG